MSKANEKAKALFAKQEKKRKPLSLRSLLKGQV